ncbi:PAS domain-containing protein [Pelagibius marinus]|uniref:PAS domain-containing protein n=1 Tax=Pelagibius marinus TaxID=2762760 RepID=UPI00187287AF|nr:PAS domain-containing protein [Pelagibius marinus]
MRTLLTHYLEVRGDKRMPSRRDIDPACLGPVLPIIWLSEYEPAAGTFRYRLAGEEVNEIFGGSVAGRLLSDFVAGDRFLVVNKNFLRVIHDEAALLASGPIYRCTDRIAMGERLVLPLSSDGVAADGLLGATARSALVDLDVISMNEQTSTFVPIDDLERAVKSAVGD